MGIFDNIKKLFSNPPRQQAPQSSGAESLERIFFQLMEEDARAVARGEVPETRLVPHHEIKRDFIIAAYTKDLQVHLGQLQSMQWTETEKNRRLQEAKADFDKYIYGIMRLGWKELDKIIATMKQTRTDFTALEAEVRSKKTYVFSEPL